VSELWEGLQDMPAHMQDRQATVRHAQHSACSHAGCVAVLSGCACVVAWAAHPAHAANLTVQNRACQ
jgi:hypothetical protein